MNARRAALLLVCLAIGNACGADDVGEACPLLAPGALVGVTRIDFDSNLLRAELPPQPLEHPTIPPGGLLVLAFHAELNPNLTFRADIAGEAVQLFLWGPRDTFGAFPHCSAIGAGRLGATLGPRGEYAIGMARPRGDARPIPANTLQLAGTLTPTSLAPSRPPCQTLEALGCGDIRCDGELARDTDGCLTCNCIEGALCGPERRAGPAGSCVLPACDCTDAPSEPVCGADGNTWPSPCAAACAGVPVAVAGACETACPALAACTTPCFGRRVLDGTTGCPGCGCMPTFAPDGDDCAACPIDPEPVCGSDGLTWPSRCAARCAGARVLYFGACHESCTRAPADCDLDCPFGLAFASSSESSCLACSCAPAPSFDCPDFGANACVSLGAEPFETTTANACVAAALGAVEGRWGPCGLRCSNDADCTDAAATAGFDEAPAMICALDGFLAGRCLAADSTAGDTCNCSDMIDPICGADGETYANLCAMYCAGIRLAHPGACCTTPAPGCAANEVPELAPSGCPTGACLAADAATAGRGCAVNARTAPACRADGMAVSTSACASNLLGQHARPEFCR
jgi:hypothetical protein